jgi:hypothetical protein
VATESAVNGNKDAREAEGFPAPMDRADTVAGGAIAAPPVWGAIAETVVCPLCGYNLRGLAEPRCPECGYRFDWPALLDPTLRLHPYLFEHHPERNVRSFLRTMLGNIMPRRFWRGLQPAQPSRVRRLLVYWLVVALLPLFTWLGHAGWSFYSAAKENNRRRAVAVPSMINFLKTPSAYQDRLQAQVDAAGGVQAFVDANVPPTRSRPFVQKWYGEYSRTCPLDPLLPLAFAAWPWLTFAALMVFAASMRRAKVRPSHVLRCAVYCGDVGAWLIPLAMGLYLLLVKPGTPLARDWTAGAVSGVLAAAVLPLLTAYRLAAAYRLYLRFDHPRATAAAAQLIVWLVLIIVLVNLRGP